MSLVFAVLWTSVLATNVSFGPSAIAGRGAFVTSAVAKNEIILLGLTHGCRVAPRGELINHCSNPTAWIDPTPTVHGYWIRAFRDLVQFEEITVNYNVSFSFRTERSLCRLEPAGYLYKVC